MQDATIKPNLVTRCARAKALGRLTHAKFERGALVANHCQLCGTQIAGLVADDSRNERAVVNGKTVIRERMVFAYFSNYREALLTFNDGSRHVACVCAECEPRLADPAVAEDAYAVAISQWVSEGARVHKQHAGRGGARCVRTATVIQE